MKNLIATLMVLVACSGWSAAAQSPVTASWNQNPEADIAGYRLIIDQTIYDVGNVTAFTTPTLPAGAHTAAVMAYNVAGGVSQPSTPPVGFKVTQVGPDPACLQFGTHAPSLVVTSPVFTGSKGVGSRASLNYQLGGPDAVVETAVQIDGVDVVVGAGADLKAYSGMWFTLPAAGTYALGVRILTSFGCALTRQTFSPLVVKP